MNKINSIFMQMCCEGCQSVRENLLPVSDAQDKQLQEMNNGLGRRNLPGWHPQELSACGGAVYLNPAVMSPELPSFPLATIGWDTYFMFLMLIF